MDGLSSAAGVIGVVQIAGQIGSQISKTRDFWQSVQEAPADVCAIILDLDLLSSVLASIAHTEQQHGGPAHSSTVNALKICFEKVRSFRVIAEEFESGFQSDNRIKKKWSACKVVFKKEKLRKLRESLMETKVTLALAGTFKQSYPAGFQHNQLYQRRPNDGTIPQIKSPLDINAICGNLQLLQVQLSAISTDALGIPKGIYNTFEDKLPSTDPGLSPNINHAGVVSSTDDVSPKAVTTFRKSSEVFQTRLIFWLNLKNMLGRFDLHRAKTERRPKYVDQDRIERDVATSSLAYYPSSWLLKVGLKVGMEIALINSQRGWKCSLSSIRAVPDNSLVFRFCQSGNIEAVRELFSRGEASVYDVDSEGQTPLHYAVISMHVQLSKFLISQGGEKKALSYMVFSPSHYIDISHEDSEAMLLLFDDCIDFAGCDIPAGWYCMLGQHLRYLCRPNNKLSHYYSSVSWLARKYKNVEPDDGINQSKFVFIATFEYPGTKSLKPVLRLLEMNPGAISDAREFSGQSFFHHLALSGGRFYGYNNVQDSQLMKLVDRGGNMQQVCFGETPTSRSLWFSCLSGSWWALLHTYFGEGIHAHWQRETSEFGLPLKEDGWSPSTLKDLFGLPLRLEFRRTFIDAWRGFNIGLFGFCDSCQGLDVPAVIEPWFEELKHRIKTESCICLTIANNVRPEYLEFEVDNPSNDDLGQIDARERRVEADGDSGTSPDPEGSPHGLLNGHQQHHRRPKICLSCRYCLGNGRCEYMLDPQPHATKVCGDNRAVEDDPNFQLQRAFPRNSTMDFLAENLSEIRGAILTAFHKHQLSRWRNKYSSGNLYCIHCLGKYEGWGPIETVDEVGGEVTHSMPGAFVE